MDFDFTEEQENFRKSIIDFCKTEIPPVPTNPADLPSFLRGVTEKISGKGWFGLCIPEEYGGIGGNAIDRVIYYEELIYNGAPEALCVHGMSFSELGKMCLDYGSEEQKKRWLPLIARGEVIGQTYTEPEAGADMTRIQTRAVRQGDHYIINGQKMFSSAIQELHYSLLMARTDTNAPAEKGISLFVMDNTSPGINISPLMTMGDLRTNQVFLDNVQIPCENLVGEENKGYDYYIKERPFYFNKSPGSEAGALRRMFNNFIQYMKQNKKGEALLNQHTVVRQKLARMAIDIQATRLLTYRMAWMETQGIDISLIASIVRVLTVETLLKFDTTAIQLLGLSGLLSPGSEYAPLGGSMEGRYRMDAMQWFNRSGPSYAKTLIATQGLGLPELNS
jgi:alkylation response protein AidB-like acyl-CoA dehydrogenase